MLFSRIDDTSKLKMTSTFELMKQFYGIQDDDGSEPPPDPTDIDGPAFEAEPYYRNLINNQNLPNLITKDLTVKKEIRELDNSLQFLVYDNYTKFLLAEETIRSMSDGLNNLSSKMQNVLDSLQKVQQQSTVIRTDLQPNREKIQRLVGIDRLLERIDFISQLPLKLRAHVDLKEYEGAVDIWLKAEKVLETQTHFESFIRIREECKSILEDVKVKVRGVMMSDETTAKAAVGCAATMIKLGMPVDSTLEDLMRFRLLLAVKKFEKPDSFPKDLFQLLDYFDEEVGRSANELIDNYAISLQKFVPIKGNRNFDKFMTAYRKELFGKITKAINENLLNTLSCEDFSKFITKIGAGIGKIAIPHQLEAYLSNLLQKYVKNRFGNIIKETISQITKTDASSELDAVFKEIIASFTKSYNSLMSEFEALARSNAEAKDHIIQETAKMFQAFFDEFDKVDARFSLLTFGVAHQFGEKTITTAFDVAARFDRESPLLNMQTMLSTSGHECAGRCLKRFVDMKRRMLSELIAQGMTAMDWLEAKTPHDVSITSNLVMQEVSQIWAQLDKILQKVKEGSVASSHSSAFSRTTLSTFSTQSGPANQMPLFHGLRDDGMIQIDRLFTTLNHLHLNQAPSFESKSVITAIAMYGLKTMLEYIRKATFSCAGFNQMQVDAYFIYMTLHDKIENPALFNTMIEELLSSAADRTISPIPFKNAVLNDIYSRSDSKPKTKEGI